MTPERWADVGRLFDAAQEVAPENREAFLEGPCNADADLKAEVRSLLASLEAADPGVAPKEADVLALDRALVKLAALDATQAKVVELRYFGGLTLDETAEVLGSSASTVGRAFRLAKAWLYRELSAA